MDYLDILLSLLMTFAAVVVQALLLRLSCWMARGPAPSNLRSFLVSLLMVVVNFILGSLINARGEGAGSGSVSTRTGVVGLLVMTIAIPVCLPGIDFGKGLRVVGFMLAITLAAGFPIMGLLFMASGGPPGLFIGLPMIGVGLAIMSFLYNIRPRPEVDTLDGTTPETTPFASWVRKPN